MARRANQEWRVCMAAFSSRSFLGNSFWSCLSGRRLYIPRSWFFCLFLGFLGFFSFRSGFPFFSFLFARIGRKGENEKGRERGGRVMLKSLGIVCLFFSLEGRRARDTETTQHRCLLACLLASTRLALLSDSSPFSFSLSSISSPLLANLIVLMKHFSLYQLIGLARLIFGLLIPFPSPFVFALPLNVSTPSATRAVLLLVYS